MRDREEVIKCPIVEFFILTVVATFTFIYIYILMRFQKYHCVFSLNHKWYISMLAIDTLVKIAYVYSKDLLCFDLQHCCSLSTDRRQLRYGAKIEPGEFFGNDQFH